MSMESSVYGEVVNHPLCQTVLSRKGHILSLVDWPLVGELWDMVRPHNRL